MNYASVVFAGFATISLVWYFVRGRKDFKGPPVPQDVAPGEEIPVVGVERMGDVELKAPAEETPPSGDLEVTKAEGEKL